MREATVVAALIREGDRFFACQRPDDKARGGLWEFPGGKVEKGESREQALIRECREELGVAVRVEGPFLTVTHAYPDFTVRLHVFRCALPEGQPRMLEHQAFRWLARQDIGTLPFCPADLPVLRKIQAGS